MQISPAIVIAFSAIDASLELGVGGERPGRRQRVGTTRSDRHDAVVRLDEIAVAGQEKRRVLVEDDQHGLEAPQDAVAPPVLGQLDGRSFQIASILLQFGLEPREQRERIGRGAGKSGQNVIVVEPANLAGALFDDGLAEGHLAVAGQDGVVAVTNRKNRGAVKHSEF